MCGTLFAVYKRLFVVVVMLLLRANGLYDVLCCGLWSGRTSLLSKIVECGVKPTDSSKSADVFEILSCQVPGIEQYIQNNY